ncbi:4'-phosphopantetheinyl transferase superfamily protein [Verminephrobacter eiseniae]|uniref:4'-phosphopantetheinyl transferase family protein n=1 Tax=Verminephrobacter eiseniae TaxID=364317 RepID=UPI002A551914|nr:4'-phosphopantetheinyl transferase superfamily protein [Verminephrobacter eiseniae]MCW5260622.1 4'-phosphopantetheinyl transferase superfamily protein [Verminephrobacter eiseniae]
MRSVLSRYAPVAAEAWRFAVSPYGRPRIEAPLVEEAHDLDFNLSHTHGLIVMALARDIDLGVDAENVGRKAALDVADHFFSPSESAALKALPPSLQAERFFALWTLKESYIKARGMGLHIPLDSFGFALDNSEGIEFVLADPSDDSAARWQFWQLQPTPQYLVAVCAASDSLPPTRIICRETMPLQWEKPIAIPTTRTGGRN